MKYFRTYPLTLQLILWVLMIYTLLQAMRVMLMNLLPKLYGVTMAQIVNVGPTSPARLINATIFMQGVFSISVFFLSAFLFSYLAHPRQGQYLGLRMPGKKIHFLLAILVMLGAMPVLTLISDLVGKFDFGPSVKAEQLNNDNLMLAFLNMPTLASFIKIFFVMAVIPGFGEELFFRGVLMRFAKKRTNSMVMPVLFSAFFFAFTHANIYGLPSIFLAGVLLAVIYNLTSSLWCGILAHILFNGTQVILAYAGNFNPALKAFSTGTATSIPLAIGGALLFSVSFYLLWKNRTPLKANWADDFTPAELQALKKEENL